MKYLSRVLVKRKMESRDSPNISNIRDKTESITASVSKPISADSQANLKFPKETAAPKGSLRGIFDPSAEVSQKIEKKLDLVAKSSSDRERSSRLFGNLSYNSQKIEDKTSRTSNKTSSKKNFQTTANSTKNSSLSINKVETKNNKEISDDFDVLVLGPGGVKGFLELGALLYLEEKDLLKKVNIYAGVSIGAIISLLLVVGHKVTDVIAIASNFDIFQEQPNDDKTQNNRGLASNFKKKVNDFSQHFGLFSNQAIKNKLTEVVSQKFGYVPTLNQLKISTGKTLMCVATNLTKRKAEYLDYINNPDMGIVDAVLLSSNIPFLFHKLVYNGDLYVDGAISDPYPVNCYDDGSRKILGIYIQRKLEDANYTSNMAYMYDVVDFSISQLTKKNIVAASINCGHLELITDIIDTVGLSLTEQKKAEMIMDGYKTACKSFIGSEDNYNTDTLSDDSDVLIYDGSDKVSIDSSDDN